MKNIFLPLFLICYLLSNTQTVTPGIERYTPSDSTIIGKPDGKLASQKIGQAGGRIISDDGRVELIFPVGALTSDTMISIQPTTNHAPNGTGKAYKFEPSGISFKKPVQLAFHYTNEDAEICPPEWMSIAMQNQVGKWEFTDYDEWDSAGKTLYGFIYHFSGFSNINDIMLFPDKREIHVKGSVLIPIIDVKKPAGDGIAIIKSDAPISWYVERILGGNDQVGTIKASEELPLPPGKMVLVTYNAPSAIPVSHTLADYIQITANIYRSTKSYKKSNTKNHKRSNEEIILQRKIGTFIRVYQDFEVQMDKWTKNEGRCNLGETFDTASFVLRLYSSKGTVQKQSIKNTLLSITGGEKCECSPVWVNKSSTRGTIHIDGIRAITVNPPGTSQPYRRVWIFFVPAQGSFPEYRFPCGDRFNMPAPSMMAVPVMIEFFAKNEMQIVYQENERLSKWKFTVKPVTEYTD